MAGEIFKIKQGNLRPVMSATLTDATGNPVNLSGASVALWMTSQSTGIAKISGGACDVVDAPGAAVTYQWVSGDTDTADTYNCELVVTFGDASTETFPSDGFNLVVVTASLA